VEISVAGLFSPKKRDRFSAAQLLAAVTCALM